MSTAAALPERGVHFGVRGGTGTGARADRCGIRARDRFYGRGDRRDQYRGVQFRREVYPCGDNVITTEMEHHANIVPWQLICERKGAELRVVPFDDAGRLMTEKLPELLDERTRIVCITQASNVLGTRPGPVAGDRPGAPGRGAGAGGRLSGYCARRGRCAGARLRFLCLFGTQTLRTYRNRRVVRQGEMAGTDAAVHGRGRYGRYGPFFGYYIRRTARSSSRRGLLTISVRSASAKRSVTSVRWMPGKWRATNTNCWFMRPSGCNGSTVAHLRHPAR